MSDEQSDNGVVDVSSITYLIHRTREGCDDSRSRVLAKLEPFLTSMASRYSDSNLKAKESLSDIVQSSFVKVIEKFDSFNGTCGAELRGWLKMLVLNEVRQIGRKWHSAKRDVKREDSIEATNIGPVKHSGAEQPIANLIQSEKLSELKAAISELGEVEQAIIRMKTSEGLTLPQIAERLEKSPASTSKMYYRSLIRIQKLIERQQK